MLSFKDDDNIKALSEFRAREEEDLAEILSARHGVLYANLSGVPIETDALRVISEEEARNASLAPFQIVGKALKVAVLSPTNPDTESVIHKLSEEGYSVEVYMVSRKSLEKAWSRYEDVLLTEETEAGVIDVSSDEIGKFRDEETSIETIRTLLESSIKDGNSVTDLIQTILEAAIAAGASDIHIEPQEDSVQIRYRIHGVLTPLLDFDTTTHSKILSRLKILSGLKLNTGKEPQDGRFSIEAGENDVEVRTSIIPGAFGESVVMRLLDPSAANVSIEKLGLDSVLLEKMRTELKKPNGMILTTGPTGSGKTTALYAFLKEVHEPGIKIITIENPVEYHLSGIVQTQVDREHGYDFYNGLTSALRQDPDVIMVGEIRDDNTATTAVQAALTGHLVFSTLHTNDAVGAIPRMRDLGVREDVLASSLNIILAQRLVRTLKEKVEVPITEEERALIENIMKDVEASRWRSLLDRGTLFKPNDELGDHAYAGRIGIFEGIIIDQETENLIRDNAPLAEIEEKGRKKYGILSLKEHGVLNVLNGLTDLVELERVVSLRD